MQQIMAADTVASSNRTSSWKTFRWTRIASFAAVLTAIALGSWWHFGDRSRGQLAWADVVAEVRRAQSAKLSGWMRNHVATRDSSGQMTSIQLGAPTPMEVYVARPHRFRQDSPDGSRSIVWDGQEGLLLDHAAKAAVPLPREMLPPPVSAGGVNDLLLQGWGVPPNREDGTDLVCNGLKEIDGRTLLEFEDSTGAKPQQLSYRTLIWVSPDSGVLAGYESQVLVYSKWEATTRLWVEVNPNLPSDFFSAQVPEGYRLQGD